MQNLCYAIQYKFNTPYPTPAMPRKIVFIGAGSHVFTRNVVRDLLTYPLLQDAHIALVDINPEALDIARRNCERIISAGNYPATLSCHTERREALEGADAIVVTILCGSVDIWKHDLLIPEKFGLSVNIGDTRSASGVFRALRTIPTMLDICRDAEELCPGAILLNYTNPMAMLCQAMQKTVKKLTVTGLCHSVQGTAAMLASWLGFPAEELDYVCAGINHMAWYLSLTRNGIDQYPALTEKVRRNKKIYNAEQVRNEMFLAFGHYVTESSGHNSEYNWWFRKRPDLIEKYCTHGTNWNPGIENYLIGEYKARNVKQDLAWIDSPDWDDPAKRAERLRRGGEYASGIINAWCGGEIYKFNGNVLNTGRLVTNLPEESCVEIPVYASRRELRMSRVGALPAQVAPLTGLSAQIEMMAVEASFTKDARLVYRALCSDPLCASKLSLAEIKDLVKAMFRKNADYLPGFHVADIR